MNTMSVGSETAFCASPRVLFGADRQHVSAVAAPVRREIREGLKPVRNPVIDLLLVRIGLGVGLADTLGDDTGVTLDVASVLAVLALHTGAALEEIAAKGAAHDVVELALDKLVAVHLVDFLLLLTNGTLATKTQVQGTAVLVLADKVEVELDLASRLKVEPARNRLG